MREIKFRAWDTIEDRMIFFDFKSITSSDGGNPCIEDNINSEITSCKYSFMQYTGLKDKNGKELYEGDIVKAKPRGHRPVISTIIFSDKYGIFCLSKVPCYYNTKIDNSEPLGSSGSSTAYKPYNWRSYQYIEVIGNIYENPELLGG